MIRLANINDLPVLVDIYNQAIKHRKTAHLSLQSLQDRIPWFEAHQNEDYPIYIFENNNQAVAYLTLSPYRKGRQALSKAVEVSYYVHDDFQQKGIGTQLLQYAIQYARQWGYRVLFAILLDDNIGSIALLEKCGFEKWGHLPQVSEVDGKIGGHFYYGLVLNHNSIT